MAESQLVFILACISVALLCGTNAQGTDTDASIKSMKERAESQTERILKQQRVIDSLERKLSNLEATSLAAEADTVAFSAYMTDGEHLMEPDGFFPFRGVESNYGNHYDPKESEFICPTTGIYFFTFTLYSAGLLPETDSFLSAGTLIVGERTSVEIFNKNKIQSGEVAMQGTNSVIIKCEREQSVWVASQYSDNQSFGTDQARRSTFSGMRLLNLEGKDQNASAESCDS